MARINSWVTVSSEGCTLEVTGTGNDAVLTVSQITVNSKIIFTASLALADQNWFHFTDANKNRYFDNDVKINPTGSSGIKTSYIQFTTVPGSGNTRTSSPIQTNFDIVNENGQLNDPTLKITW